MNNLIASILTVASIAVTTPATAHPPPPSRSTARVTAPTAQPAWIWVPAHLVQGIHIRGQWKYVEYGSQAHLRHRSHRPSSNLHVAGERHHRRLRRRR